jgi:competence protein ComFC
MNFFSSIFNIFFPKTCACCEEQLVNNEIEICLKCRFDLPLTNFTNEANNMVEKTFHGRISIEFATALIFYKIKGISQKLIYQLKYKGRQEIGTCLGMWLGTELKNCERFKSVDFIVPVPLHPKKLRKRGFNQLTTFGKSISEILEVPFLDNVLIKKYGSDTQTLKHRIERWKNVNEIFYVTDLDIFKNKHVLLIDDVITTGATLEACALKLSMTKNIKISICTMAYTE